ncbi:MAG: LysR family transcriptional regulator [Myxococcales bacterium]|nr:LysR family transcriptional regulator [Myxococcales bacterium]MCB9737606.1 LysR family transcriptional regulator [Deltaproteobacteria bacterium]
MKPGFKIDGRALEPDVLRLAAVFAAVAREVSFTRAATALRVSPSAVSQAVRALEERLAVRLLDRTTRKVGLTEAGRVLVDALEPALGRVGAALGALEEAADAPRGTLRLTVPKLAVATLIAPRLDAFARAYPDVVLDVTAEDRLVDLVAEGYDAGIRLGEMLARDTIAVKLTGPLRAVIVGAPAYLARRGTPREPADLHAHDCVRFRMTSGAVYRWELERDGRAVEIDVGGPLVTNDSALMVAAAVAGVGLAMAMEEQVADHVAAGRLVTVLDAWCPPFPGFYLHTPSRAQMPAKLRAFIDHLTARGASA